MSAPALAPTGTLRAAVEQLTADLDAAVRRMRTTLEGGRGEEADAGELVALTGAQVKLLKTAGQVDALAAKLLAETSRLRDMLGMPITEHEMLSACDCPDCRAKVSAPGTLH